jgi:hypothetical protein
VSFTQGKDLFNLIKTLKARHPDEGRDPVKRSVFVNLANIRAIW